VLNQPQVCIIRAMVRSRGNGQFRYFYLKLLVNFREDIAFCSAFCTPSRSTTRQNRLCLRGAPSPGPAVKSKWMLFGGGFGIIPRSRHLFRRGWVTLASGPQTSAATAESCPFHTARIRKSEPADRRDREDTGRIRGASDGCIPGISVSSLRPS
jgi:hypothetical protein